jgi:hypothetical protein
MRQELEGWSDACVIARVVNAHHRPLVSILLLALFWGVCLVVLPYLAYYNHTGIAMFYVLWLLPITYCLQPAFAELSCQALI